MSVMSASNTALCACRAANEMVGPDMASVSYTSERASSRAHADAHVDGSVKMGRGPTAVVYLIASSAITEDDTDADAS